MTALLDHRWRGGLQLPPRSQGNGRARRVVKPVSAPILSPDQLAALRDRLLGEIAALASQDSATAWAHGALAPKNRLTADDAKLVADAFEQRLATCPPSDDGPNDAGTLLSGNPPQSTGAGTEEETGTTGLAPGGIDNSELAVAAPRRYRDRDHLRHVAKHASSAVASHPTHIILGSCSRGRSVARPATNSWSRSVESIIGWCTAWVTKRPGGRTPASIRSRLPVSSGSTPAGMRGGLSPSRTVPR